MSWAWEELVKLYDKLELDGKPVCPIAHTYITAHIAVLVDKSGNFLAAMEPAVKGELVAVPCTIESEGRTSNIAPHLISDQLQYVADFPSKKAKHKAYIEQLKNYINNKKTDIYAKSVYNYVSKNTVLDDIRHIIPHGKQMPTEKINIVFAVYGLPENDGKDLDWAEYYTTHVLPINGMCSITGKPDHIPQTYPRNILTPNDYSRLFMTRENPLDDYPQNAPGYIASQKVIHVLQYMIYGKNNIDRVDAEYHIMHYMSGDISKNDLKEWTDKKHPGKWEGFIKILEGEENEGKELMEERK